MGIVKVAIIGIAAVILALQFKGIKAEYSSYISLAAGIIIFGFAVSKLEIIIEGISTLSKYISVNKDYIGVLVKVIGISYICEFASALCKDAGYSAIASQIEMVGKLSILVMRMPILMSLLETVDNFLQ